MEKQELDIINKKLDERYGRSLDIIKSNFRIVWSEDQFEKRLTTCSKEGLTLLIPEVVEVPKYRQWTQERYILERLTVIPETQQKDLAESKLSYEPIWVFQDSKGNALEPNWIVCQFLIDSLLSQVSQAGNYTKYKDTGEDLEEKNLRLNKLKEELFGNESEVGDALAHKDAVIVPRNFEKQSTIITDVN